MNFTHQAKRGEIWFSWGFLLFWFLAAVFFFTFPAVKIANEPLRYKELPPQIFIVVCIFFFLFWILLSSFLIIYCIRFKIHVTEDAAEKSGIFRHGMVDLDRVTEAHWHANRLRGTLSLQTAGTGISLGFSELTSEQAQELVLFFRRRLPEPVQKGWDRYWESIWPLFDQEEARIPEEIAADRLASRRFFGGMYIYGLIVITITFLIAWRYTSIIGEHSIQKFWFLCVSIYTLFLLGFFVLQAHQAIPKRIGLIAKTRPQRPRIRTMPHILGGLVAFVTPLLVMASSIFKGEIAGVVAIAVSMFMPVIYLFLILLWHSYKQRPYMKRLKQWNREAAQKAAELYLNPSPELPKE